MPGGRRVSRMASFMASALPLCWAWANAEMMASRLDGRHALITGGGTGIGAAAAAELAKAGAKLSLLGRRTEPPQEVAESFGGTPVPCDVTDSQRIVAASEEARGAT